MNHPKRLKSKPIFSIIPLNIALNPCEVLKTSAIDLGFELCGVVAARRPVTFSRFETWVDAGMHAGMNYLAERREARSHPRFVLENVRSILMLSVSYERVLADAPLRLPLLGVARYARGGDYHHWIRQRLRQLAALHRKLYPEGRCRGVADTAPLLERQFAVDAGLGRIGKNSMLIHPKLGSTLFLAALLSTEDWPSDTTPDLPDPCGNCRRCLDACPTGALVEPYVLDARRCLNYWTIEQRGEIPEEIAEKLGNRFFGCDTCQDVCPWNRAEPQADGIDPRTLDAQTFETVIHGTPMERRWKEGKRDHDFSSQCSMAASSVFGLIGLLQ